jgi:hypothetical protein
MPRRLLVDTNDCLICESIAAPGADATSIFARGYIAGMHVAAVGNDANERLCAKHALALSEATRDYVGTGVRARERGR